MKGTLSPVTVYFPLNRSITDKINRKRVGVLRHYSLETYANSGNWLGISLLHQGAPVLIPSVRVAEEQTAFAHWQSVIHNHLHPLTILPELHNDTERRRERRDAQNRSVMVVTTQECRRRDKTYNLATKDIKVEINVYFKVTCQTMAV